MAKFVVHRVEDGPEDYPFDSIRSMYLTVQEGVYIFHDYDKKLSPIAVYPVRSFRVAKESE